MKKRILTALFTASFLLSLTACGGAANTSNPADSAGKWRSMEDYVQNVMQSQEEITYWSYDAAADETSTEMTAAVTDRKLEYLRKGAELTGLAPEGTLEEWRFYFLVKFDAAPESVSLAGGQYSDDAGYFALEGSHEAVALRYPDGSYDVLYDAVSFDHSDFFNYCNTAEEALHDWYVSAYGLNLPLYVEDWNGEITYNDSESHGNYPVHRYDGNGFSIYIPVDAWIMQEPSEHHWEWYSAYDTGSTIVVDYFTQPLEDLCIAARKQGFAPTDDNSRQAWSRCQGGINEQYWFYEAADGSGSWRVWTLWTDASTSGSPYIFIEPQVMTLMAKKFLVSDADVLQMQEDLNTTETHRAFGKVLWDAYQQGILPDGTSLDWISAEESAKNIFTICDIDGDGQEELLLYWTNASMAGNRLDVFGYRGGQVFTELTVFPSVTFYDNGVVVAEWSHNQGLAGMREDFWPYDLYAYDAEADIYREIGAVDGWDHQMTAAEQSFPAEIDADGDGMVYFLLPGSWDGHYDPSFLVDGPEYEAWRSSYLDEAEPLNIETQTLALTEENIAALGYPRPDAEIAEPAG